MPSFLLMQLLRAQRYMNPADDGSGAGGGGGGGGDDGKVPPVKEGGEEDGEPGAGGDKKPKVSDAEAKLLKEVMQKKDALTKANEALTAAQARLSEFDGIDPAEIKKLLADKKTAEDAQLAAKGDFETLKKRMADEHQSATKSLQDQIAALTGQLSASQVQIEQLSIGNSFAQSQFLAETVYTPAKARVIYGPHFDFVEGAVVGYDKPRGAANRTPLVDQFGNNMAFDQALQKLVEADPDKDSILKSKVKPGAGSSSRGKEAPKNEGQAKDSISRIGAGLAALKIHG